MTKDDLPAISEDSRQRFGGLIRLYGEKGLQRLLAAKVAVIGLGGVGSWVVESLARSAVGHLRLVDLDDLCLTNINRQLPALSSTVGKSKVRCLAERVREISPECRVEEEMAFYTAASSDRLLDGGLDYVVDAIDSRRHKAHLIASCRDRAIPIITCGAAGGRRDPLRIDVTDLARAHGDVLLSLVRRKLREEFGFPKGGGSKIRPFRIEAVYSSEAPVFPTCDGEVTARRDQASGGARINCDTGYGAVTHLTGAFGFVAASRVVLNLAGASSMAPRPMNFSAPPSENKASF